MTTIRAEVGAYVAVPVEWIGQEVVISLASETREGFMQEGAWPNDDGALVEWFQVTHDNPEPDQTPFSSSPPVKPVLVISPPEETT